MSNDQQRGDQREDQREKASTRNVSSDDSNTTKQERRTCLYDRLPFLEADDSEERTVEISN